MFTCPQTRMHTILTSLDYVTQQPVEVLLQWRAERHRQRAAPTSWYQPSGQCRHLSSAPAVTSEGPWSWFVDQWWLESQSGRWSWRAGTRSGKEAQAAPRDRYPLLGWNPVRPGRFPAPKSAAKIVSNIFSLGIWPTCQDQFPFIKYCRSLTGQIYMRINFLRPVYTKGHWLTWSVSINVSIISH